MAQTGHPDWLRTPVGIAGVFVNKNLTVTTNGIIVGTFYVSDYPNLAITFQNTDAATYQWLELRWDTVNNPLAWSSKDVIATGPGNTATLVMPTKGTWVQMVAFSDVAPSSISPLLVYGTTSHLVPDMYRAAGDILINDASAYTASQVKTFDALDWYTGPAVFSVDAFSATGAIAEIRMYSTISKLHVPYMELGVLVSTSVIPRVLYIPPRHLRVVIYNGSTAQTIRTLVSPAPLWSG